MARRHVYVALLRGVNVGGRTLSMKELAELFSSLGYDDVQTYIQSGNVVFSSTLAPRPLAQALERAIAERFGHNVRVLLRTYQELTAIERANPFPDAASDGKRLHVVYLDHAPKQAEIATLDPERSPGDTFAVEHREIYLSLPNGLGHSKLTLDYFERRLGVAGTARNWNTLLRLIELTSPRSAG